MKTINQLIRKADDHIIQMEMIRYHGRGGPAALLLFISQ
jgi:hypothetical protein